MITDILVPIKTKNERLPNKNTKELCGRPLYFYLFRTLKNLQDSLGKIYIDSSDRDILITAEKWGFTPSERPPKFNSNNITGDQLIARVIHQMECDTIGLLHVTTPFLSAESVLACIRLLANEPDVDSAFGVCPRYNRFWFNEHPINHDPMNLERTQDLKPVYEEADFYFVRKTSFLKYGKRVSGKTKMLNVNSVEAMDIDTLADFLYAEALIRDGVVSVK